MLTVRKAADGKLKQIVEVRANHFFADEPLDVGDDQGPSPHEILDAALGACTAMTLHLVARRKQWPLEDVRVTMSHHNADGVYTMQREIELVGALTEDQRQYLLGIANKCPVHKTLGGKIVIESALKA